MTLSDIDIWLWVVLFFATVLYEFLTVVCTIKIMELKSIAVANLSVGIGGIGMACVYIYTDQINNMVPILAATWIANFWAIEREKRKKKKRDDD